jgi:hypothetical protein
MIRARDNEAINIFNKLIKVMFDKKSKHNIHINNYNSYLRVTNC